MYRKELLNGNRCSSAIRPDRKRWFVKSIERAIQLLGKPGTIHPLLVFLHQLVPARVVNRHRRNYLFGYSVRKREGALSEVARLKWSGMRAFGWHLPIGDSSNVILEPEGAGYSQK
jgi:hypothetical protein